MASRASRGFGQYSGLARALERVGDKWALLIVRDLLVGARRYSDLKASLPRIPTNILSDRLRELQDAAVVRRVPTVRGGYELTERGRALEPVVIALERWGWASLGDAADGEVVTADALVIGLRAAFRVDAAAALPPTAYVLHVGAVSLAVSVDAGDLEIVPIGPDALPQPRRPHARIAPALEFAVEPAGLSDLLAGASGADAPADRVGRTQAPAGVRVLGGEAALLGRFRETFRIAPAGASPSAVTGGGDAGSGG